MNEYKVSVYHGAMNIKKGKEFAIFANSDVSAKRDAVRVAKENSANSDDIDLTNIDTGKSYKRRSYFRKDKIWQ
jgi:hypothetical protein